MPKTPKLSVSKGDKLPVSRGAGLTAKGRAKINKATGINLKAPAPKRAKTGTLAKMKKPVKKK